MTPDTHKLPAPALHASGGATPPDGPRAGLPQVPGFDLLGVVGRGGMGVVYRAVQLGLNRTVALKTLQSNHPDERLRFLAEAEAVAAIQHPNVVQVHEFGVTDPAPDAPAGVPFLAMEFVGGGSLAARLSNVGPLDPWAAAELVEEVARGVQAAHEVGIVHRDLKPANILLPAGPDGQLDTASRPTRLVAAPPTTGAVPVPLAKVSDFGIAKRGGRADLTRTGVTLGTPAYMSPEQARGQTKFVGPGSDVHALGAILVECLTGQPPFAGDTPEAVMFQVMRSDPPSVRSRNPRLPRDLDLICRKCLEKRPADRYPSAAALADDLRRFLAGEAVSVRPPGGLEKGARWVRRHPLRAAAAGLAALVLVLSAVAAGFAVLGLRADDARRGAEQARAEADEARRQADAQRDRAEGARGRAEVARNEADQARADLRYVSAVRAVDLAFREFEADNPARARQLLGACPPELRSWEWRHVDRLVGRQFRTLKANLNEVEHVSVSTDGAWLAACGQQSPVRLWNLRTGQARGFPSVPARWVTAAPGGRFAAETVDGRLVLLDPDTGGTEDGIRLRGERPQFHPRGYTVLVLSRTADGPSAPAGAVLQDARTGAVVRTFPWPEGSATAARFSPTGDRVAVAGRYVHPVVEQLKDGPREDATAAVRVYDTGTGRELCRNLNVGFSDRVALDWSPDGTRLATASGADVRVWDAATGEPAGPPIHHPHTAWAVGFDPAGGRLVVGYEDRTARVWDAATGRPLDALRGHSMPVRAAQFLADGEVLTGGADGTLRFWRAADAPTEAEFPDLYGLAVRAAVSSDGRRVALAGRFQPSVWVPWLARFVPLPSAPNAEAIQIWNLRTGRLEAFAPVSNRACDLDFSADGATVAAVDIVGHGHELTVATNGYRTRPAARPLELTAAGAARGLSWPDDRGRVTVLDRATGETVAALDAPPGAARHLAADGRLAATGGDDGAARVWDAGTGRLLHRLAGHATPVAAVALSPDGLRLATAGKEGWIKVWDVGTGFEVLTVRGEAHAVQALAWSPDGSKLLAFGHGRARVLDAGSPVR